MESNNIRFNYVLYQDSMVSENINFSSYDSSYNNIPGDNREGQIQSGYSDLMDFNCGVP